MTLTFRHYLDVKTKDHRKADVDTPSEPYAGDREAAMERTGKTMT